MKKSNLTILLGIIGLFITLSAANLKLQSHFKQGKIASYYTTQMLPAFHHIKEVGMNKDDIDYYNQIIIRQQKDSSAISYEYYKNLNLLLKVENDTLYLIPDLNGKDRMNARNLTILCPELKSLSGTRSSFTINKMKSDTLSLIAENQSNISFLNGHISTLEVLADSLANVKISLSDTIIFADIQLKGLSSFKAEDVIILNRKLKLSYGCSLSLSGKSLENFGVRKN